MVEINEVEIKSRKLRHDTDLADATSIILNHLKEDPEFLRTAPHTTEGVAEWFERKKLDAFWFAEIDAVRIGMVGISRHVYKQTNNNLPRKAEICRLMVSPDMRGYGFGRLLFDVAFSTCKAEGPWLTVLVGSEAEKMYRDWGWQELGQVPSQDDPLDHVIAMHLAEN